MVGSCSAYGCKNRWNKEKTRTFHRFPFSKPVLLEKWVLAVRRADWQPTKTSVLCSDHFSDDCYRTSTRRYLKVDAVPDIFCFTVQSQEWESMTPKNELPPDACWSEYEPLSPTSESIIRALNFIGVSPSWPIKKEDPDNPVLTRAVPLQILQHLTRPQVLQRLNCKRTSPTSQNNTNSSYSTITASTSTGTTHRSHSCSNKKKKLANASLTRNVSLPIKRYLKYPLGVSRFKCKRMTPADCLKDKNSPESKVTASASTDTIHGLCGPLIEGPKIEMHDSVLTRDASLPVIQYLNHSKETTSIETHDADLTCDESLPVNQHLNHPQEIAGIETYDAVLTPDESLPVNQHLNHPQETAGIETHDASLPINRPLDRRQETAGDRCEEFGKNVATKLRELPNQQRIICEKIINDALSKAKQGFLTPDHVLCKIKPSYYNYRYKARLLARQIKSLSQDLVDA